MKARTWQVEEHVPILSSPSSLSKALGIFDLLFRASSKRYSFSAMTTMPSPFLFVDWRLFVFCFSVLSLRFPLLLAVVPLQCPLRHGTDDLSTPSSILSTSWTISFAITTSFFFFLFDTHDSYSSPSFFPSRDVRIFTESSYNASETCQLITLTALSYVHVEIYKQSPKK